MRRRLYFALVIGASLGCDDPCPVGLECVRSCPSGTQAICNAESLCLCQPDAETTDESTGLPNGGHEMSSCADPRAGELVISEVLVDGEPTEAEEFIEIVNLSLEPTRLKGISIWVNRGQNLTRRVAFLDGCLPAGGTIAMFSEREKWITFPMDLEGILADVARFGFSNSNDVIVSILAGDGQTLDYVRGSADLIEPGASLARSIYDGPLSGELVRHMILGNGRRKSPGLCPNGGRYHAQCMDVQDVVSQCARPEPGTLIINEVLIDGELTEAEEFVEMVNPMDHPVSLAGLTLLSNRGQLMVPRVKFYSGCLPPKGMLAMFSDERRWLWQPLSNTPVNKEILPFGFANQANFKFELRTDDGRVIDVFSGHKQLIQPGTSINRTPDVFGEQLELHTLYTHRRSSPSKCTTGHNLQFGCFVKNPSSFSPSGLAADPLHRTTHVDP